MLTFTSLEHIHSKEFSSEGVTPVVNGCDLVAAKPVG